MAIELAVAYVNLIPSARGMRAGIEKELDLDKVAKTEGAKAGKGFAGAFNAESSRQLQDTGKKLAVAGVLIAGGMLAAANAAGNLEAAIAANVQVLGEASSTAREFAKDSVDAVGLSERAALEATTSFGGLGKIIGLTGLELAGFSIEMVTAAADMAAFKDVPVDQALADLQSGFAGSTEVLRKYNIFLDDSSLKQAYFRETGQRVTGVLTSQQRVLATHSEILSQGADMWGQWDRESESLAAEQSKLKAELENMGASIGASVLPAVISMTKGLSGAFGAMASANEASGGLVSQLGFVAAGTLSLGGGAIYATGKITQFKATLDGMSSTAKFSSAAIGGVGLALTAAALIYDGYNKRKQEAERVTQGFVAALEAEAAGQENALLAEVARKLSTEQLIEAMRNLGVESSDVARFVMGEQVPAIQALVDTADKLGPSAGAVRVFRAELQRGAELTADLRVLTEAIKKNASSLSTAREIRKSSVDTMKGFSEATEDATTATKRHRTALDDAITAAGLSGRAKLDLTAINAKYAEQVKDATEAERDYIAQIQGGLSSVFEYESSLLGLENAYSDYEVQFWETTTALKEGTLSERDAMTAKNDLRLTEIGLADQVALTALEFAREQGAVDGSRESAALQIDELERLKEKFPGLRDEIDSFIDTLNGIEGVREARIITSLDRASYEATVRALSSLGIPRDVRVQPGLVAVANGDIVSSPTPSLIGEDGIEAVLPLTRPGRMVDIVNDSRVRPAVMEALDFDGGGGASRNINFGDITIESEVDIDAMFRAANFHLQAL